MNTAPNRQVKGFTLVELMITLVIVSVLLGAVAPGLVRLLENNRIQTAADDLFTGLMLTRSEALKRNQDVIICKSANGTACATGGGTNWHDGWLVYADTDGDSAADPNEILRVTTALRNGDTMFTTGSDFDDQLSYGVDGTASGTGTFVVCNEAGDVQFSREVSVAITGRPKLNKSTTDCTP